MYTYTCMYAYTHMYTPDNTLIIQLKPMDSVNFCASIQATFYQNKAGGGAMLGRSVILLVEIVGVIQLFF